MWMDNADLCVILAEIWKREVCEGSTIDKNMSDRFHCHADCKQASVDFNPFTCKEKQCKARDKKFI